MNIVKEALDVEEQCRASALGPQGTLGVVCKGEPRVQSTREGPCPKLGGGYEPMFVDIVKETFRHTFLDTLTQTFDE